MFLSLLKGKVAKDYFVEPLPKDWNDKVTRDNFNF